MAGGDVHPAVEFVRCVRYRADRLEAEPGVQMEAGPVVGGDGGDDRAVTEAASLVDQLGQESLADATPVVDGIHVDQVLDDVESALIPPKQARPADHAAILRRPHQLATLPLT